MLEQHNLPPFSMIVAPSYLHPMIRSSFTRNQAGCIGMRIHSLSTYLYSLSHQEPIELIELMFSYQRAVKPLAKQLQVYASLVTTPSFLKECHSFIEDMKFYDIKPAELPESTFAEQEIKLILSILYPLTSAMDITKQVLQELPMLSSLYIYDAFYNDQEQCIIEQLLAKGAHMLPLPKLMPEKSFYHAINLRQEVEACAQKLILDERSAEDCVITLASANYKPVVEQVFQRYQIPYTLLQSSSSSIMTQRFSNLISYAISKEMPQLLSCMDADLFAHEHLDAFREYIDIFQVSLQTPFQHLQGVSHHGHILDELEVAKLKELEEIAETVRQQLLPAILKLHTTDPKALIQEMLTLVKASMVHASLDEIQVFTNIQNLFATCYEHLESLEDIAFLQPFVEEVSISHSVRELHGVLVCDLQQIIPDRPIQFLLGATQKNYPGYRANSGIFDEAYWKKTALPSMEERYQHYLKQCEKLLHANQTLIVSYPLGTYEGKGNEAALEIEEEMACRSKAYPLIENYEKVERTFHIQADCAKQLFVKDHHIKGSISAIERYIHCPYSYFLRYGLSLREPMEHGFSTSYMGTLSHFVLEALVEQYGKTYTKAAIDRIQDIVDEEVAAIQAVFPNNASLMNVIKHRFMDSFLQTLQRLDDFEAHSAMKPYKKEYEFLHEFRIDEQTSFALKGFIDRIDASGNMNCILDYKSSSKALSEDRVFAALQLQLLTYSIVAKKDFGKDILGAYYISLKNENIPYAAGKMKRRPVEYIESDLASYEDAVGKAHRLHGWTMRKDIDMLDDNGNHIVGVSCNKDGVVKARTYYRYDALEEYFSSIYQIVGKRMLHGDIGCTPDADACLFCAYASICRFKGFPSERKPLIEAEEDSLYWEGGEHDATME